MLSDPQTVTVNAVAKVMPRVISNGTSAKYMLADESFALDVSHQKAKDGRIRSLAKLTQRAIVTDPVTNVNDYETLEVHVVINRPNYGFTQAQVEQLVAGLFGWENTAMVAKLFGQES